MHLIGQTRQQVTNHRRVFLLVGMCMQVFWWGKVNIGCGEECCPITSHDAPGGGWYVHNGHSAGEWRAAKHPA